MKFLRICLCVVACLTLVESSASWYWPFGEDEKEKPRLSTLMEKASLLIDEASDCASEGKVSEAVDKYRAALVELNKVEAENPERAKTTEFASLRTKRAYVTAAIDSLLLSQARDNAKPVAVSDTTELERRLAEEKAQEKAQQEKQKREAEEASHKPREHANEKPAKARKTSAKPAKRSSAKKPPHSLSRKEQIMKAISEKDFDSADAMIAEMLAETPNNAAALNLRAAKEAEQGRFRDAERTLDQAIRSNPRNHFAYYNMAALILEVNPANKDSAKRYYETGRALGGPKDDALEEALSK